MPRYYSSKWLQSKSIGLFVSAGVHLLLLGIILPKLGLSQEELIFKGRVRQQRIKLVSLTPQQKRPESVVESTPSLSKTVVLPKNPENSLPPLPVSPNLDSIAVPPILEIPEPPPFPSENLPLPRSGETPILSFSPPPIPRELVEIINPTDDSVNSPKLIQPEINPDVESEVAINSNNQEKIIKHTEAIATQRQDNLIASVQAKAQSLKYNPINTRPKEVKNNYDQWISWQEGENPPAINWQGNYPKDGCIKKIQGTTVYGVLVDPHGKIINLHLIQSAGYSLLNEEASKEIEAYSFKSSQEIEAYVVTVGFNYNSQLCPSLTLSPK